MLEGTVKVEEDEEEERESSRVQVGVNRGNEIRNVESWRAVRGKPRRKCPEARKHAGTTTRWGMRVESE